MQLYNDLWFILFAYVFFTDDKQMEAEQKEDGTDLSPILFDDSPSSPKGDAGGPFELFGTSIEEAVREMRFRIEQKTTLTASAGERVAFKAQNTY